MDLKKITGPNGRIIGYIRKDNIGHTVTNASGHILGFTSDSGGTYTPTGHRIANQSVPGLLFNLNNKNK
jgi:hypothetical protein